MLRHSAAALSRACGILTFALTQMHKCVLECNAITGSMHRDIARLFIVAFCILNSSLAIMIAIVTAAAR